MILSPPVTLKACVAYGVPFGGLIGAIGCGAKALIICVVLDNPVLTVYEIDAVNNLALGGI